MAATPDVTAIAATGTKNAKKLIMTLLQGLGFLDQVNPMYNVKGSVALTKLTVANGWRPYDVTLEDTAGAAGDLTYTKRTLTTHTGVRVIKIDPQIYKDTWMNEYMGPSSAKPKERVPFATFVWDAVIKKVAAEIDESIYLAEHNAVGTTAADVTTGWGKIIADEITALNITPVATGAINNTNAVAKFEQVYKALPVAYKSAPTKMYCSIDNWENYQENYDATHPHSNQAEASRRFIRFSRSKCEIVPATWMGTSNRLICTPQSNLVFGTNVLSDLNTINTVEKLFSLTAGIKAEIGCQIADLDALVVNDQA